MKFATRLVHTIVYRLKLEFLFLLLGNLSTFFLKFLPLHRHYKKGEFRTVNRDGVKFNLDLSDYMQWYIFVDLTDNSWIKATEFLAKGCSVLDIGANSGAFCLKLGQRIYENKLDDCTVSAFEPNPFVFSILKKNLELNPHLKGIVKVFEVAIGAQDGLAKIVFDPKNTGAGKIHSTGHIDGTEVTLRKVDTIVEEFKLKNIRFMKIDVEGFEPYVIQGSREVIKKYRPGLFIEMTDRWFKEKESSTMEIRYFLKRNDYELLLESDQGFKEITDYLNKNEEPVQYNMLAIPN